jgi:hypothetical protein
MNEEQGRQTAGLTTKVSTKQMMSLRLESRGKKSFPDERSLAGLSTEAAGITSGDGIQGPGPLPIDLFGPGTSSLSLCHLSGHTTEENLRVIMEDREEKAKVLEIKGRLGGLQGNKVN